MPWRISQVPMPLAVAAWRSRRSLSRSAASACRRSVMSTFEPSMNTTRAPCLSGTNVVSRYCSTTVFSVSVWLSPVVHARSKTSW